MTVVLMSVVTFSQFLRIKNGIRQIVFNFLYNISEISGNIVI